MVSTKESDQAFATIQGQISTDISTEQILSSLEFLG